MTTIKTNFRAFLLCLAAACLVACALFMGAPRAALATADDWSGHDERIGVANAVLVTSTAQLIPSITGKRLVVVGGVIGSDVAGVVQLQDGNGGTTIAAFLLPAGGSYTLSRDQLGQGVKTTAGNALYAVGPSTAHVTGTLRYQVVSQ